MNVLTDAAMYGTITAAYGKGGKKMVSEKKKASNAKWDKENRRTQTVFFYPGKNDPTKEQIAAAAKRDGMSVNAWIVEAIKDKL